MKRLFTILLFLLLCTPIAAHAAPEQPELILYDVPDLAYVGEVSSALFTSLSETGVFDPTNPGYGGQLTDPVAIAAYQALEAQFHPDNTRISVELDFMADANWATEVYPPMLAALSAYVFDHPESQFCNIRQYGRIGNTAVFLIPLPNQEKFPVEYELVRQEMLQRFTALETATASYAADFDTTLPRAEQYRIIHDDICRLADYNYEAAAAGVQSDAHTAYGLLVDNDAVVCEGYSKAFKVLCDAVGLPCILVAGEGSQSSSFTGISNHMWNAVCIDDAWYSVDLTWDDLAFPALPDVPDIDVAVTQYKYFLDNTFFLDSSLTQDHRSSGNIYFANSWPMTFSLPALADGQFGAPLSPKLILTFQKNDLSIPDTLFLYGSEDFSLGALTDITLNLTQDAVFSSSISIPAGYEYRIDTANGVHALSRSDGFTDPLFRVDGTLTLNEDLSDPSAFSIGEEGTVILNGDLTTEKLVMSSGTLHIYGELIGCLEYEGGVLTLDGTEVTASSHRHSTYITNAESHSDLCFCGQISSPEAHALAEVVSEAYLSSKASCTEGAFYHKHCSVCGYVSSEVFSSGDPLGHIDDDFDQICDTCAGSMPAIPTTISALTDTSVSFSAGTGVTNVSLCVAGYTNGQFTGSFFRTVATSPGQTVTQEFTLDADTYRVFLMEPLSFAPLCHALSSTSVP